MRWEERKDRGGDINTPSMEMALYTLIHPPGNAITHRHKDMSESRAKTENDLSVNCETYS